MAMVVIAVVIVAVMIVKGALLPLRYLSLRHKAEEKTRERLEGTRIRPTGLCEREEPGSIMTFWLLGPCGPALHENFSPGASGILLAVCSACAAAQRAARSCN